MIDIPGGVPEISRSREWTDKCDVLIRLAFADGDKSEAYTTFKRNNYNNNENVL